MLIAPFDTTDFEDVLFTIHLDKSSSPDGMNPSFYKIFWHIAGEDAISACLNFINSCDFPKGLNDISIILFLEKSSLSTCQI